MSGRESPGMDGRVRGPSSHLLTVRVVGMGEDYTQFESAGGGDGVDRKHGANSAGIPAAAFTAASTAAFTTTCFTTTCFTAITFERFGSRPKVKKPRAVIPSVQQPRVLIVRRCRRRLLN